MWNEFPNNTAVYDTKSQFMLGSALLIAPKLYAPTTDSSGVKCANANYYLPSGLVWYNYTTGVKVDDSLIGNWVMDAHYYADLSQPVWAKGGSILPILSHDKCLSLNQCKDWPMILQVFLSDDETAEGQLYLDDGVSQKPD